jgi:hypothetical protein
MEQNSQVEILEAQIRECYGRVVWTHKIQEKCADILNSQHDRIKFWQIVLSALTTSGILIAVFGELKEVGILSALVSLILTILNTYVKKYNLGSMAQKHADAAISIWNIRESYLSLLTDMRAESIGCDEVRTARDKLQGELHKLYKGSPRSFNKAYSEASKALKEMDEMTFTDQEIDKFLPKELRKATS